MPAVSRPIRVARSTTAPGRRGAAHGEVARHFVRHEVPVRVPEEPPYLVERREGEGGVRPGPRGGSSRRSQGFAGRRVSSRDWPGPWIRTSRRWSPRNSSSARVVGFRTVPPSRRSSDASAASAASSPASSVSSPEKASTARRKLSPSPTVKVTRARATPGRDGSTTMRSRVTAAVPPAAGTSSGPTTCPDAAPRTGRSPLPPRRSRDPGQTLPPSPRPPARLPLPVPRCPGNGPKDRS